MSLNIGGAPIRKIYWGPEEIQEVRQGPNMVFVPSADIYKKEVTQDSETFASSWMIINTSSDPGPIDTAIYKRLKIKVSFSPGDTFHMTRADLAIGITIRNSDKSLTKNIELADLVTCTADTVGKGELLCTFPDDLEPLADGLIYIVSGNYKPTYYDVTAKSWVRITIELEAIC